MSQVNVQFAELHNPLFHAGKSFGTKLDPGKLAGLKLVFDEDKKRLLITWEGVTGHVPEAGVALFVPGEVKVKPVQYTHPIVAGISKAQVETPMSHVHAGHGHGKAGIGEKVK